MTKSMTAFARLQSQNPDAGLCWEIRSVNHRYLEPGFRLPEPLRFLEPALREILRGHCSRGKVDCQLKWDMATGPNAAIKINEPLLDSLISAGEALASRRALANDLSLATLLTWPGVIDLQQPDLEAIAEEAKALFLQAVLDLCHAREREGQELNAFINTRLDALAKEVDCARKLAKGSLACAKDRLMTRLQALQLDVETNRIEQEIALLLEKMDVSEELDRLMLHQREVARILQQKEASGRRLDFLMQELNREANTLGSKSDSAELTQSAIEMKVLIEQMREQIQNIE